MFSLLNSSDNESEDLKTPSKQSKCKQYKKDYIVNNCKYYLDKSYHQPELSNPNKPTKVFIGKLVNYL